MRARMQPVYPLGDNQSLERLGVGWGLGVISEVWLAPYIFRPPFYLKVFGPFFPNEAEGTLGERRAVLPLIQPMGLVRGIMGSLWGYTRGSTDQGSPRGPRTMACQ